MLAPARAGLPVAEYAATVVKKAVVGTGGADKTQVAFMVAAPAAARRAIPRPTPPTPWRWPSPTPTPAPPRSLESGGMIGRLRGVLAEVGEEEALIDVGGVGYVVRCGVADPRRACRPLGEEMVLHIESQTREDGTRLYGFLTREERRAFVLLQDIQGVGPKAALAVLDVLTPAELAGAIAPRTRPLVGRAQGVGPKLALRIVVELKDKPIAGGAVAAFHAAAAAAAPADRRGRGGGGAMGLGVAEAAGPPRGRAGRAAPGR